MSGVCNKNIDNALVVGCIPESVRASFINYRYSSATGGDLTFWTMAFDGNNAKFTKLFGHKLTSTQSVITVALPNGQEYYLTGGFRDRPFVGDVAGDLIVIQIRERVYCLSISADLAIKHTFTLRKPVRWYESAILAGDCLTVHYTPLDKVTDNEDANAIPDCETFNLAEW